MKADRLMLVGQIAPVSTSDAAVYNWSATSIAIRDGKAYVTWHSNRQASNQATMFGGALDIIDIQSGINNGWGSIELNGTYVTHSLTSDDEAGHAEVFKFNNIISDANYLYIAGSGDKNGAMVARLDINNPGEDNRVVSVPGSSANAMAITADGLNVVTGYAGGAYKVPAANFGEALDPTIEDQVIETIAVTDDPANLVASNTALSSNFGGKFITGNYILRTDESNAALISVANGTSYALDAALLSSEKYGESFDDATDSWKPNDGPQKAIYGKHNFAELDGFVYVAAGTNGLRVYEVKDGGAVEPTAIWDNGILVNAVCAFNAKDQQGNLHPMIAAATGNGLRIYRPYNKEVSNNPQDRVLLYAYEVDKYDENGNAESTTAYANGHSANYIAVDETNGLIFVAYGQTGVNVYKLDESLYSEANAENLRQLIIPAIANTQSKTVEKATDSADFKVPNDVPAAPEGKVFAGWVEEGQNENPDAKVYKAGDTVTVTPDNDVVLVPLWKNEGEFPPAEYNVKFDLNGGSATGDTEQTVTEGSKPTYPQDPTKEGMDFVKWVDSNNNDVDPETFVPTGDVTITAVWKEHVYKYVVNFMGWTEGTVSEITNMPSKLEKDVNSFDIPSTVPVFGKAIFKGWSTTEKNYDFNDPSIIAAGTTGWSIPAGVSEDENGQVKITLYGVWASDMSGDTEQKPAEPSGPVAGAEDSNGKG